MRTGMPLSPSWRQFPRSIAQESGNSRALPSGHLEQGESVVGGAVREAGEEVGVVIDPSDLTFVHIVHYRAPGSEGRIGFYFRTERWAGDPSNREPGKCIRPISRVSYRPSPLPPITPLSCRSASFAMLS